MPNNKPDFSKLTLDDLAPAESNEVDFSKLSLDSLSSANQEQPDFEALPSLYDEFEIADDEQLYKMMKAEPGKAYSREQWDRYLTYMSEKDFSPMQVTKAFFGGIGPMLTEIGQGGLEVAKEISKLYATDGSGRDRKALENIAGMTAEGSLRAGYDMGMIGHMIALNESLSDTVATSSGGLQGGYGSGYSFPNYQKRSYKDFPEDKKDKVIGRAMKLAKYMSDREKYATGQDTIMGDLTSFFADDEESVEQFEAVKDTLAATINPKGAEFLSIFNPFAPEALAAGVGRKFAKPVKLGAKDKVLAAGQVAAQKSADAAGYVREKLDEVKIRMGDEASDFAKVRGVSPGMMQSSFQTIADTLAATRRQVANSGSENFFMKMSRDGDYARANPRMHQLMRFLGHGIYNDIPALSPVLRTAAPAARVVVDTAGGAIEGGVSGGIMVLPTQDEDMIGTTMTSGSALGATVRGGRRAFWDNKIKVNAAAETFLNTLGPDLRKIVDDRIKRGELGMGDIARMASFENWLKGFTRGVTGDTDVDFIYWDGADMDFVEKVLIENGVDQALKLDEVSKKFAEQFGNADADRIVSPTRGVQILNTRRAGSKPIALVNLNSMSGTTSIHEGIHALKRLDLYRGAFDDLEAILFDKPGRGEDAGTNGLVSDADLQRYYNEYIDRFVLAAETPEQKAQASKLAIDIVKADQLRADNATPGTPQAEVEYWQRVRMKDEVVSDVFESFLANKDPLYITKTGLKDNTTRLARPFSQVVKTMTSWIMANSNGEALSVQNYTGRDGKRLAYDSPELEATINGLINFRNRVTQKDGKLTRAEAAEGETGDAFKRTQIKRGTALAKSLESSLLVKHDDEGRAVYDADGNIVFEDSQKAVRDKERKRQTFLRDTITSQIIEDTESIPGKEPVRFDKDTEEISGDYLHEDTMKLLRNAPRSVMPKSLLEHLEKVNEAIKTGNVIELDYNPRLFTKNGRSTARAQYSSALGSTIRLSIPFSMRMTKAGNFTINTLDVTHLVDKYNRVLGDSKRSKYILSAWGNDRNAFNKDLAKYLENTINPPEQFDGGLASGLDADPKIARQKANRLSAFMGFKKKDIDWKNNEARQDTMLKALNPERQDNLIRTRRLDGINSVRSTDLPRMPLSRSGYKRIQRNFEPGEIGGFNVRNEDGAPFADLIASGEKTIETRPNTRLDSQSGKRLKIIRTTGVGSEARVVGEVTIGPRKFYGTKEEFDADLGKHFVTEDSKFAFPETGKYGYEMLDPVKYQEPYPLTVNKGITTTRVVPGRRYEPGSIDSKERLKKLDVGDKTGTQVGLSITDYPKNPDSDSVALPARRGLVNENIVGVPDTYDEVLNIVEEQVNRIAAMRQRDPEFAKRSAGFYEDMARVGLNIATQLKPKNRSEYDAADLIIRLLALGSPRSSVSSNSSKSVRSAMAPVGASAGFKIGMGTAQLGAKKTASDWNQGNHFDVLSKDAIGADDKVRNFYLNALADLIDMAAAQGKKNDVLMLQKRVAKTLGLHKTGEFGKDKQDQVQTFLDGLATVDMWDMAAKGYAHPAWITPKGRETKKEFAWSVPKHRVETTFKDPLWNKALSDAEIQVTGDDGKSKKRAATSPMELDYQFARAFQIDGRRDWDPVSWEARKAEGFDSDTEWSYYAKNDEGGLSPGGSGPVYDAQQMIDGLIADELNSQGVASFYGKTKIKARNAQEILWAIEKLDNPYLSNRELVLFGDRLNDFTDALKVMFEGGDVADKISDKAARAIALIEDTYNKVELQTIPIEVTSQGKSAEAKAIQDLESEVGVEPMTQAVADNLVEELQSALDTVKSSVLVNKVKTGRYTEGKSKVTPNILIELRGKPNETREVMEAMSLAWDQDGGNLMRRPTLEELSGGRKLNTAVKFDTTELSAKQKAALYEDLSKLTDGNGQSFLTGYTETVDGMFIGDQFYDGDMGAEIKRNIEAIKDVAAKHNAKTFNVENIVIEDFSRPAEQADRDKLIKKQSKLSKAVYELSLNKIQGAREKIKQSGTKDVNQKLEVVARAMRLAKGTKSVTGKTARDKLNVALSEPIDLLAMDGDIDLAEAKDIKADLKKIVNKIPLRKKRAKKKALPKKKTSARKKS
jgi:hypothetical protein